ncbi:hypothetical protein LG311_10235 [Sutcliffiella horikoshii]|uniref:hypothetical protein n=1 Tax=Sutcliffiella horikoshii TaxID=79883 RepID=UPI00384E307F
MYSSKKYFVDALSIAKASIDATNKNEGHEEYMTYLTANGLICGKVFKPEVLDFKNGKSITDELEEKFEVGSEINIFSLTNAIYDKWVDDEFKENKSYDREADHSITLEDVQIKTNSGQVINSNLLVLFADQVIGVIPGKMNF